MLMILARLVRSESFWAVAKVRSPHTGPEPGYPRPRPRVALGDLPVAPRNDGRVLLQEALALVAHSPLLAAREFFSFLRAPSLLIIIQRHTARFLFFF